MTPPILRLAGVAFSYGNDRTVFQTLKLDVVARRRLAVLGANGVGKSTLLLLLNGTLRPHSGGLFVDGNAFDYSRHSLRALRSTVGIVLQDPDDQLFAPSVEQDVAFGLLNRGVAADVARREVECVLTAMGIVGLRRYPISDLSVGEKKRVALAGVLVMKPRVVLLDEPTAGLDGVGTTLLLAELERLREHGTAVVVSTHDTDFALEWADDAAVLADGTIAIHGPVGDVLEDEEALRKAKLRMPRIFDLALHCRRRNREMAAGPLPRTPTELCEEMASLFSRQAYEK